MSLLKAILDSNYTKVSKSINRGDDVNDTLNSTPPPVSMLDVAIETDKDVHSSQSQSIITLLKSRGAKTYNELIDPSTRPKKNLPPLSVKGIVKGNIKTHGIAGLSRGGLRRTRRLRRKNRH
jgi:hypothetical protein